MTAVRGSRNQLSRKSRLEWSVFGAGAWRAGIVLLGFA
jgi:hypothetical protein